MSRFTIRSLMGSVIALAIAFAALRNADDYWSGGVLLVTLILMATAVLAVVYERGTSQAAWLGFLVFGGAYLGLSLGQLPSADVSAKLPTTRFMSYAHARVETVGRLRNKLVFQIVDRATGTTTFDANISTDVDVPEGKKVVVGKTSALEGSDGALILVISAKVVD